MTPKKTAKTVKSSKTSQDVQKPVALTLRVSRDLYRRLAIFAVSGADIRTHQEVVTTALTEYLNKNE